MPEKWFEVTSVVKVPSDRMESGSARLEDSEDLVDYDCDLDLEVNKARVLLNNAIKTYLLSWKVTSIVSIHIICVEENSNIQKYC